MNNEITDDDLERFDWWIITDVFYIPSAGMYEKPMKVRLRLITAVKPN